MRLTARHRAATSLDPPRWPPPHPMMRVRQPPECQGSCHLSSTGTDRNGGELE
ncbi:hypothetical protein ACW5WU_09405 [Aeromonas encheleia]|uniref:hypothetical protein n=1 Tax=Aeromonas encheleia TaxID=73010 RepID=UPI00147758CC|nr:hypothetical protein [Aeromonas encheleia]